MKADCQTTSPTLDRSSGGRLLLSSSPAPGQDLYCLYMLTLGWQQGRAHVYWLLQGLALGFQAGRTCTGAACMSWLFSKVEIVLALLACFRHCSREGCVSALQRGRAHIKASLRTGQGLWQSRLMHEPAASLQKPAQRLYALPAPQTMLFKLQVLRPNLDYLLERVMHQLASGSPDGSTGSTKGSPWPAKAAAAICQQVLMHGQSCACKGRGGHQPPGV